MNIQFTDAAVQAIKQRLDREDIQLKLVYDIEGCGCAVSGIAALWAVNQEEEHEATAICHAFPIRYNEDQKVFFEDELTIDVNTTNDAFVLKSKNQIYNSHMALVDRTALE